MPFPDTPISIFITFYKKSQKKKSSNSPPHTWVIVEKKYLAIPCILERKFLRFLKIYDMNQIVIWKN